MSWHDYEAGRRTREQRAEPIAAAFHESYERQARNYGYETRPESAVPWENVPDNNKALMRAVVNDLIDRNVIYHPRSYEHVVAKLRAMRETLKGFKELLDD